MTASLTDKIDADEIIANCLNPESPKSFFLFAGAGSGKTRSLVVGLNTLRDRYGNAMRLRAQQVSVITYTNAACDEIQRRLDFDPLFSVSTIHKFVWGLIKGFNHDIRRWLQVSLARELQELHDAVKKGSPKTKIYGERLRQIEAKTKRLQSLPKIKTFAYNPNGENRGRDSLNHAEVIKIGADFLATKSLMQRLLISQSPILLIDESQDTNKSLMEALMVVQAAHKENFALGLLGDTMQRIYSDGKSDLGVDLPDDWETPAKLVNHRCPRRVIDLLNKVRGSVDSHLQEPKSNAPDGVTRLFVTAGQKGNEIVVEKKVREAMASYCNDPKWSVEREAKTLILEHHMAARRMGFIEMYEPLYQIDRFKNGLRDGTLPILRLFSEMVLPVLVAKRIGQEFAATAVIRKSSPLLERNALQAAGADQKVKISQAKTAVESMVRLCEGNSPTFADVLNCVAESSLFPIPGALYPYVTVDTPYAVPGNTTDSETDTVNDSISEKMNKFLSTPFWQIERYAEYVREDAVFGTHQGVKGLEFSRVLVIMDDAAAGGFLFSYDKLFGATPKSKTDLENAASGKETTIDRTRRLFYVTCSRSEESLAILAYSSDPKKVARNAIAEGWFKDDEIEEI
jgi:DNA helicase-2/ATP-dependent DNA helicase PcrA